MPLSNYTFIFNGLTIGAGTNYLVTNVEGLGGTSPLRIQDDNRGYIDGSYTGRDFYDERTVYIDVTIVGDSSVTAQSLYKDLQNAYAPQQLGYYVDPTGNTPAAYQLKLFQFRLTGDTGDKRMYGRSRGLITNITPEFSFGYIQTRIAMVFPDPRYYDDTGTTVSGLSVSLNNLGWAESCPVININSVSATSGTLTDGTTVMSFANLAVSANLKVDLLQRVIYYNGTPTRNKLTSSFSGWLSLAPLSGVQTWTSNIGSMSITYRNAYV